MRTLRRVSALLILFVALLCLAACGPSSETIVVIALHPKNPDILYVATNDYIYKSRDEGKAWELISRGMSPSRVIALAIDPAYPATVYAGMKGDAVYKSYDGGQRWVPQKAGLDDVTITSVVNQLLFAPGESTHLWAATTMGVFESADGGDSWKKRMDGMKEVLMVVTLAIDPVRPDVMYAGTSGGVYKSTNRAKVWAKANDGLISPELLSSSRALMVNSLLIDPLRPDTVYAATLNGLYKTMDGARAWTRIGRTLPDQMITVMALDPSSPGTLYIAGRRGLFKSADEGATWQAKNAGLASLNIRSLAISPSDSKTVYLGTNGSGLYRSRDGGETWTSVPITAAHVRTGPTPPSSSAGTPPP
jgi:photosystem II stability/assembly factor-like uncharacterized protein